MYIIEREREREGDIGGGGGGGDDDDDGGGGGGGGVVVVVVVVVVVFIIFVSYWFGVGGLTHDRCSLSALLRHP